MTALLKFSFALSIASSSHASLTRRIFNTSFSSSTGARCLDGSPAGYFFEKGDPSSFVIFLQGGGACYSVTGDPSTNCASRAKTALGSSAYWPATYTDTSNVVSSLPVNPFANFTRIFVPYCSGDVHLGTRLEVVSPSAFPFYFSGHLIVAAVVQHLKESEGLGAAASVLLAGSSAGGIGAFVNADFVAAQLPAASTVRAAPQGGWFFPAIVNFTAWRKDKNSGPPYAGQDSPVTELWQSYLNPSCVAANSRSYCSSIEFSYKYIATPLHVSEDLEDSNQLFAQLGAPQNLTDPEVVSFITDFQSRMRAGLSQVIASPSNGLWAPACLAHTENLNFEAHTKINSGRDYTLRDSLSAWFFGAPKSIPRILVDACNGVSCNPTCPQHASLPSFGPFLLP